MTTFHFPDRFLWGAATASHQVEGGNRWNDWWEFEQAGRVAQPSGDACRHYELYERDFDQARELGHNAHRFSLEWSRIEPRPGEWNEAAIEHYRDVVAALRRRGMEPIVGLHHFTNPAWFAHDGGWLHPAAPARFARYVERAATALPDVKYWITVNEPTVFAKNAYVGGGWPPGVRQSWRQAAGAMRGMARAHMAAYRVLHRLVPESRVGFAHSAPYIQPCRPGNARDRLAARIRDFLLNRAFFRLIGGRRTLDFAGINYYNRTIVRAAGRGLGLLAGRECLEDHHPDRGPVSDIGWEVYPPGLGRILDSYAGLGVPLMITENGIATRDETLRSAFLRSHLAELAGALSRGVPVIGYLYWTLMDNFEWSLGFGPRFGLLETDFDTQRRTPRPAALELAKVCRTNRLAMEHP